MITDFRYLEIQKPSNKTKGLFTQKQPKNGSPRKRLNIIYLDTIVHIQSGFGPTTVFFCQHFLKYIQKMRVRQPFSITRCSHITTFPLVQYFFGNSRKLVLCLGTREIFLFEIKTQFLFLKVYQCTKFRNCNQEPKVHRKPITRYNSTKKLDGVCELVTRKVI